MWRSAGDDNDDLQLLKIAAELEPVADD